MMYFVETLQVRAACHGVCCIVFDIDGMLFEFFMIFFLNIEKQVFLISCFMLFSTYKKNIETPVYPSVRHV